MTPIVEPDAGQKDKRTGKTLSWREAKISLAHAKGSRTPVYAGMIEGGGEKAGRQLFECAVRAGFRANSRVHAVADGAPWIVGQVEEQFGEQGGYLIDFYHVCECLSDAAKAIEPDAVAQGAWVDAQKDALKSGGWTRRCGCSLVISKLPKWTTSTLRCGDAIAISTVAEAN
jgi:hypothetical protein